MLQIYGGFVRAFSLSSFELFCVFQDFNGLNRSHLVNYLAHLINFEHSVPHDAAEKIRRKGWKFLQLRLHHDSCLWGVANSASLNFLKACNPFKFWNRWISPKKFFLALDPTSSSKLLHISQRHGLYGKSCYARCIQSDEKENISMQAKLSSTSYNALKCEFVIWLSLLFSK